MKIAVWIVQILLVVAFGFAGSGKLLMPIDQIHQNMPWSTELPDALVRFIGASELLGALGLLLPSVTRVLPKLTVAAAFALVLVMVLAAGDHLRRGELPLLVPNFVLGGLAAFVGWARLKKVPIAPRSSS